MSTRTPIVDRVARVAPWLVAAYWRARIHAASFKRLYEAAQPSNYHRRPPAAGSADHAVDRAGPRLWDWARHLDENSDLAVGILDYLCTRIVGPGLVVTPAVLTRDGKPHPVVNAQIEAICRRHDRAIDVSGQLTRGTLEALLCRSWLRDGDVFMQHVQGRATGYPFAVGALPYVVEPLEAEMVPLDYHDATTRTRFGIQFDTWGRPLIYHVALEHPGDTGTAMLRTRTKRVRAEAMTHLAFRRRLRQSRGVSILAAVIHRLDDIKEIEDTERVAARVAAALTAVLEKSPEYAQLYGQAEIAQGAARDFQVAPGMVLDRLLPGEKIGIIKSDRPNPHLPEFRRSQIEMVAAGTMTAASSISRRYDGSYASQRQELVESRGPIDTLRALFADTVTREIHRRRIDMAIASGLLQVPADVDLDTLDDCEIAGPGQDWIDPAREANGAATSLENNVDSPQSIMRRRGLDPRRIRREILEWREGMGQPVPAGATPRPEPADPDATDTETEAA